MFPVFTSESVTRGHPDKVADQISDTILDVCLAKDPMARVAAETLVKGNNVYVAGEVTVAGVTQADFEKAIRETLASIGYSDPRTGFDAKTCRIIFDLTQQSPDIDKGVNKEQGAGDQGMMFGYATDATPNMMPLPIFLANGLVRQLTEIREKRVLPYLWPDAKSQVSMDFRDGKPVITHIVLSTHHQEGISLEQLNADVIEHVIVPVCEEYMTPETKVFVNPAGLWHVGGPVADSGLTGRKIMVDTYGSWVSHGGGAFCIAGNARVNTALGMRKIADCAPVAGALVKTDVHPMHAGVWYDNGVKETVLLTTTDGYSLEATPEHRIRVLDAEGNYAWREIRDLKPTDYIPIQAKNRLFGDGALGPFTYSYKEGTAEGRKKKYVYPERLTDDYAYLLGLLVGDGDCTDDWCVKICVCEEEQRENVQGLFQRLFGERGKLYGHWAYIGGVELRAYLEFLCLSKVMSFDKEVPEAIWNGTKTNVAAFLRGLFDTDGCVRIDGRNRTTPRIHLATTSKKLAEEVQLLLLSFGSVSALRRTEAAGKVARIRGRTLTSRRALYSVTLKGTESVRRFRKEVGFGLPRKAKVLDQVDLRSKGNRLTVPNQRMRIVRLFKRLPLEEQKKDAARMGRFVRRCAGRATKEATYGKLGTFLEAYEGLLKEDPEFQYLKELYYMGHYFTRAANMLPSFAHTYDLNIPLTHTFTANGFVVHNSGKDPTKVDRSAAYAARWVAKHVVAAGLAKDCLVQISYAIGKAEPLSLLVHTHHTGAVPNQVIEQAVRKVFDLRPAKIIEQLQLRRPIYRETAYNGHFGRAGNGFTWERIDEERVRALRAAAGLN